MRVRLRDISAMTEPERLRTLDAIGRAACAPVDDATRERARARVQHLEKRFGMTVSEAKHRASVGDETWEACQLLMAQRVVEMIER